jgi:hypothetical protein
VAAACDDLAPAVRVVATEPAGTTYRRLATGKRLGADGWLVAQPWPAMLEVVGHPLAGESAVLARTPVDLVTTAPRPAALRCDPPSWSCLADFAAAGGAYAHAGADQTVGLLSQAGIAGGLLGRSDYARNDFDEVDAFRQRYAAVERGVADLTQGLSSDVVKDIQRIQGAYQAVTALGADVEIDRSGFEALSPQPQITADVVLAGRPDRFDLGPVGRALRATGWWRSDDKRLVGQNGLPNPGVMVALRDLSTR